MKRILAVSDPVGDRGIEDIRKHPPIRGVCTPHAHREQRDLVLRGPLRQRIGKWGAIQRHYRCPRRPVSFQALVARHTAGDVIDCFAFFPHQGDAVDAAIALVEQGQIGNVAIGTWDDHKPLAPLTDTEHGEKLCARRYHRRVHQTHEHGGHEHTPPLLLQAHTLVLPTRWLSSRLQASIA